MEGKNDAIIYDAHLHNLENMKNTRGGVQLLKSGKTKECNLGRNIVDISAKLSNMDFSMKCFTADFSHFCSKTVRICLLCGRLSYFPSFPSILRIFLKFPKNLSFKY